MKLGKIEVVGRLQIFKKKYLWKPNSIETVVRFGFCIHYESQLM